MVRARSVSEQTRLWMLRALAALLLVAVSGCLLLTEPAHAQRTARVLHRNIAQLVDKADVIFRGEVLTAYTEPHPTRRVSTVVVTLRVLEVLKGQSGATYTFRQYLWDVRDTKSKLDYGQGQQYVLLMRNPNSDGLTSPSGMEQGRFLLSTNTAGLTSAANAYDNVGLLRNIEQTTPSMKSKLDPGTNARMVQHQRGPISYQDLKNMISSAVAASN